MSCMRGGPVPSMGLFGALMSGHEKATAVIADQMASARFNEARWGRVMHEESVGIDVFRQFLENDC